MTLINICIQSNAFICSMQKILMLCQLKLNNCCIIALVETSQQFTIFS